MAYLWPIISPPQEYVSEARYFRDVILEELGPGRHTLLELGVGGGHNLSHLTVDFDCTAVDLSLDMLALSEGLNPGVPHWEGDMRYVRLGKIFDVVLIHDAASYILTEEDLQNTFATAAVHLRLGGVFMVAPSKIPLINFFLFANLNNFGIGHFGTCVSNLSIARGDNANIP